jgi:hypothetical protein
MSSRLDELLSNLKKNIEEAKQLTTKKRKRIRDETFAFPKQRKMPLNDASHVRSAAARFNQVKGVSESEKRTAYRKILRAGKKFSVDLTGFREKFGPKYG